MLKIKKNEMKESMFLKRIGLIVLLCGVFCFVGCEKDPKDSTDNQTNEDTTLLHLETIDKNKLLQLVNDYRASGCNCGEYGYFEPANPVKWNAVLQKTAEQHSIDMYLNSFFSHTGSDNSTASERLTGNNYDWKTCGENIAQGFNTEEKVVNAWIASPGHCKNIMNPDFKEMGLGKAGDYWTQVFATPK